MSLTVKVLFFGEARDVAGTRTAELVLAATSCTISFLLGSVNEATGTRLSGRLLVKSEGGGIGLAPGYKIMLNKRIMTEGESRDIVLKDGDEVGILPPFSGG